jgi:hypothetical protein
MHDQASSSVTWDSVVGCHLVAHSVTQVCFLLPDYDLHPESIEPGPERGLRAIDNSSGNEPPPSLGMGGQTLLHYAGDDLG